MKKNLEKFITLDPSKIVNIAGTIFYDVNDPLCKIQGGNWDTQFILPIEDSVIYKSLYEMFVNNKDWNSTELYKLIKDPIVNKNSKCLWGCINLPLLDKRGEHLHKLYKDIKERGVLKHEVAKRPQEIFDDEIMIAFDRNGTPLSVRNGNHRLAIAKILKLKNIPVKVYRRHEIWEETRNTVKDFCKKTWEGRTYHPVPHPDLAEIKSIWSESKYELFKNNTESKTGSTILDVGSLFGYFCYKAELDGYNCTACEIDKNYLDIMKKMHKGYNMNYHIIEESFLKLKTIEYDIIFAFNILHHFLKTEALFKELTTFLQKSKFKEMYVQFHNPAESQMINAYKNFTHEEFAKYILEKTGKTKFSILGEESKRKFYKIY